MRVALVGCGKLKLGRPARAADMYRSGLFRLNRRWAERNADRWLILSAKYGLLEPDRIIAPYEFSLQMMSVGDRARWASRVSEQLREAIGPRDEVVMMAGELYAAAVKDLPNKVSYPLAGLAQGKRMQWLKSQLEKR